MLIYFTLSNRQNIHILPQQSNRHATPPLLSLPPIAKLSSFSLLPTSLLSILPFICFCPLPLTPHPKALISQGKFKHPPLHVIIIVVFQKANGGKVLDAHLTGNAYHVIISVG